MVAASDADLDSVPARLADRVQPIGPAHPLKSYLSVDAIVQAAIAAGADAIHPGYGFLSENAALARRCQAKRIVFIGPTHEQLERIGDKLAARRLAARACVPLIPGGSVATLKLVLAVLGLGTFFLGVQLSNEVVRWAGIGLVAAAVLLRFVSSRR